MSLRNIESAEAFCFDNLEELRDFLNRFETTDLNVVFPAGGCTFFKVVWEVEILSDGSKVNNARIDTF